LKANTNILVEKGMDSLLQEAHVNMPPDTYQTSNSVNAGIGIEFLDIPDPPLSMGQRKKFSLFGHTFTFASST
jgi:hypothetical protein